MARHQLCIIIIIIIIMELLYSNDLVLIAETNELLLKKVRNWKEGTEKKGLRVNAGKKKIMWCRLSMGQAKDSGNVNVRQTY